MMSLNQLFVVSLKVQLLWCTEISKEETKKNLDHTGFLHGFYFPPTSKSIRIPVALLAVALDPARDHYRGARLPAPFFGP